MYMYSIRILNKARVWSHCIHVIMVSTMYSDLSSGSPAGPGGKTGQRSPMPPPQNTPTRLQTIRNQTLKLHLPGSGRNYISLPGIKS